jgi:hypothetical protein
VQPQDPPLEDGESADAEPFGLLNVENWSCLRPLPHFGQATCSLLDRTSRSYVVSQSLQTYS